MKSKTLSNSFSDKSDSKLPSKVSNNSEHKPTLNQNAKSHFHPTATPISLFNSTPSPHNYPNPSPSNLVTLKSSLKKSPIFEAQREPPKDLLKSL